MASRSGGGRAWSPGGADGDQAGEGGERAVAERELEEAQRARELAGDEVGDRRSAVGDEVDGRQQPGALCGAALVSRARMLPAKATPCAVPAMAPARMKSMMAPECTAISSTPTASVKTVMPARCAVAADVRPANGAPIAPGAMNDAK